MTMPMSRCMADLRWLWLTPGAQVIRRTAHETGARRAPVAQAPEPHVHRAPPRCRAGACCARAAARARATGADSSRCPVAARAARRRRPCPGWRSFRDTTSAVASTSLSSACIACWSGRCIPAHEATLMAGNRRDRIGDLDRGVRVFDGAPCRQREVIRGGRQVDPAVACLRDTATPRSSPLFRPCSQARRTASGTDRDG